MSDGLKPARLPSAEKYGGHHLCVYGVVGGMAVMAVSLAMLG